MIKVLTPTMKRAIREISFTTVNDYFGELNVTIKNYRGR